MQKYTDVVQDINGNAVSGASVTIKVSPGGSTATIYSDNASTSQSNPITTDADGRFTFYAKDGSYYASVSKTGITGEDGPVFTLRDTVSIVTPEGFGAVGDGTTNDYDAFAAAISSLGSRGGVVQLDNKKYRITGATLSVPKGVSIEGKSLSAGIANSAYSWDPAAVGSCLLVDSSYTLNMNYNTGISQCWLVRYGLTVPTDATTGTAAVAAFAGTAITVEGSDVCLDRLSIIGFDQAVYHKGIVSAAYERPRYTWIMFDCNKGIRVDYCGDLGYIHDCRGFPFLTAFRSWTTDAHNTRTGPAFWSTNTHDWGQWENCNSYGYTSTFKITDSNNVTLTNCGADHIQGTASAIGFEVTGTCQDLKLIGCKSTLTTGYKFNFTGHVDMIGCSAWGSTDFVNVVAGDVDSYASYWHYLGATAGTPWIVGAGAGYVALHGDVFNNSATNYPSDPFSVNATAQSKFRLFGCKYKSTSTTQLDQVGSDWAAWSPTITSGTGTLTTTSVTTARYMTIGKTVIFRLFFTITTNGTGATDIRVTAPLTVSGSGVAVGRNLTTGKMLQGQIVSSGLNEFRIFNYDNTYPAASGDQFLLSGSYETS